jgi:hypothetical protein
MKNKKQSEKATRAAVEAEMAKPRLARSVRVAQLNLDRNRTREPASTTMDGTVIEIIPSRRANKPGSAQIELDVDEKQHRDLRIKNELTDEHGDDVKLKKGASVEVTIAAKKE